MPDPPTNSKSMNPEISQILEPIRLIPTKNNTKTNSSTFGSLVLELVGGSGDKIAKQEWISYQYKKAIS